MGFRFTVTGEKTLEFDETIITAVEFVSDTPDAANARSNDLGVILKVTGRINFSLGAEVDDSTDDLAEWALLPSDKADCYREAQVQVINGGQIIRQYKYPNAFVMGYTEDLDDGEGVGTFEILMKQKKDLTSKIELKGNFE